MSSKPNAETPNRPRHTVLSLGPLTMHAQILVGIMILFGPGILWAAEPRIPLPGEVIRYERLQPVFKSKRVAREHGDALLRVLDGGKAVERWGKGVEHLLIDPPPTRLLLELTLTNGITYRIGFTHDGGVVELHDPPLWTPTEPVRKKVEQVLQSLESELREEITRAPKPCTYRLGTVEDGSTLSGVARLFYGDASKWSRIYEANRKILKNPNMLSGGVSLIIPMLK